jgi:hypothetical protein
MLLSVVLLMVVCEDIVFVFAVCYFQCVTVVTL